MIMATLPHEEQLQKIFSNVNDWLKFAEAKNFGLLTLNAAILFGTTQIDFSNYASIQKVGLFIFAPISILAIMAFIISLFPILSEVEKGKYAKIWISKFSNFIDEEKEFENIHFYGYLKKLNEAEFELKFLEKVKSEIKLSQFEIELVTQILYNSRITFLKYQLFKIGAFLFLCGIIASLIALPLFSYFS